MDSAHEQLHISEAALYKKLKQPGF